MRSFLSSEFRTFVLTFHGLGKPPDFVPPDERGFWVEVPLFAAILDLIRERKDVRITFDDSNDTDYTKALPLLRARNLSASFFILAGKIGQPGYLSKRQVESLLEENMAIGCHGMNHRPWTCLNDTELHEEVVDAKDVLQQIGGKPVSAAACPFGNYNRAVLRKLRGAGYTRVHTSDQGPTSDSCWLQPRNTINRFHDLEHVRRIVTEIPSGRTAIWRKCKLALKRLRW